MPTPRLDKLDLQNVYYRLEDGPAFTKKVPMAPDELAQASLYLSREAELLQAIARLRLFDRTGENPATCYLLTSIALPILLDEILPEADLLASGNRESVGEGKRHPLAAAMDAMGGVLSSDPVLLAKLAGPNILELDTPSKAEKMLRNHGLTGRDMLAPDTLEKSAKVLLDSYGSSADFSTATYKALGAPGKRSVALIHASAGDPRAAVAAMLQRAQKQLGTFELMTPASNCTAQKKPVLERTLSTDQAGLRWQDDAARRDAFHLAVTKAWDAEPEAPEMSDIDDLGEFGCAPGATWHQAPMET